MKSPPKKPLAWCEIQFVTWRNQPIRPRRMAMPVRDVLRMLAELAGAAGRAFSDPDWTAAEAALERAAEALRATAR